MSALRNLLLPLCAAALGYALGTATDEHRVANPSSTAGDRPNVGSNTASAASHSDDDAVAAALGTLLASSDFRQLARLGSLLDQLDSAQMRAFLDKLDRLPWHEREVFLPRLLANWTKRDPQAATEWMQPRLERYARQRSFGSGFANLNTHLVNAWAENAPQLALECARQHPGGGLAEIILPNALRRLPSVNDAQRFEILRDFPAGITRQKVMTSFFFGWAQTDRTAALAAAAALPPGLERDGALTETLRRFASKEPAAALARADAEGFTDPALLTFVVGEAGKADPAVAAHWLEQHDDTLSAAGGVFVREWAKQDPAAAFAWAASHGISPTEYPTTPSVNKDFGMRFAFELAGNSPIADALREKPEATLAWLRALPAGADRDRDLEHAIVHAPDVTLVESLVAQLPPEAAARAAASVAGKLASKSPEQAQQWAESLTGATRAAAWTALGAARNDPFPLPPGADRDAMLGGMATARATTEPAKALDRALEIGDPTLRRRTLDDVFWELNRGPIDLGYGATSSGATDTAKSAARDWLTNAKIPEDWKQAWLK